MGKLNGCLEKNIKKCNPMKKIKPFSLFESEEEKTYSFSELPKEVQDKVVDYFYDINVYDDWDSDYKGLIDEKLVGYGIADADIRIEGDNYNRFDVVFTSNNIDVKNLLKHIDFDPGKFEHVDFGEEFQSKNLSDEEKEFRDMLGDMEALGFEPEEKLDIDDVNFYVTYPLYSTKSIYLKNLDIEYDMNVDAEDFEEGDKEIADHLIEPIKEFCVKICDEFGRMITRGYEEDTSSEAIIDAIEGNDYRFDENGNLI